MIIHSQRIFVQQDGGDFYLFADPNCSVLLGPVSYGSVRDFDMVSARAFREEFRQTLESSGIYSKFT